MGGDTLICCQRSLASLRSTLHIGMSLKAGLGIWIRVVVALVVTQRKSTFTDRANLNIPLESQESLTFPVTDVRPLQGEAIMQLLLEARQRSPLPQPPDPQRVLVVGCPGEQQLPA